MKPRINGTLQPVRTSLRSNYDPTKGITVTQEFESAGDGLGGLANEFFRNRIQYEHHINPRKSKLLATASGAEAGFPELTLDRWELLANENQKDIKEHPAVIAIANGDPSLADVLQAVSDYNENIGGTDPHWFTDDDTASLLFRLLIHGVTSYALGQYVLRHTTNVSNAYDANVADLGVESVYSTSALISEISDSGFWLFPCPGRLIAKIERIEVQDRNADLNWGWRKLPSTETTAANNRIDITTEYWLAGWSKLVYALA